jgi:hypothetical protein
LESTAGGEAIESNVILFKMPDISEKNISCPYCGEPMSILVEEFDAAQSYTEDCQVCCQPIVLNIRTDSAGVVIVGARSENE